MDIHNYTMTDVRIRVRVDLEQISLSLKTHRPGSQFPALFLIIFQEE